MSHSHDYPGQTTWYLDIWDVQELQKEIILQFQLGFYWKTTSVYSLGIWPMQRWLAIMLDKRCLLEFVLQWLKSSKDQPSEEMEELT